MPSILNRIGALTWVAMLSGVATPLHALVFLTEENPPFNYAASGKAAGISTEIVTEMARRAGIPAQFSVMKWEEAYQRAQADKDVCVYSIARLENRENQLRWVGELVREAPLWLACNPRVGKDDIAKLASALAAMNKDGSRKRLLDALEKRSSP